MADSADFFAQSILSALRRGHVSGSADAIRYPSAEGAFPTDFLLRPPPVVVDANRLRNDILRTCRTGERTVLVNAANGGLLRLFAAHHVINEVREHSAEWAADGSVSQRDFLKAWLLQYLPLIRVVRLSKSNFAMLSPDEAARMRRLHAKDRDDVPSATLSLLLQAFYLSNDGPALRAVYGDDANLAEHDEWVTVLKAGGDAGELGRMFALAVNVTRLTTGGVINGARRLGSLTGPLPFVVLAAAGAYGIARASAETRQRLKSAGKSVLDYLMGAAMAYEESRSRFERTAPAAPGWLWLAGACPPDAVLARACMHTLARSAMSDRSAAELARDLPVLTVAQGEAKVRHILRTLDSFEEVWRGRWQLGEVAPILKPHLPQLASLAEDTR